MHFSSLKVKMKTPPQSDYVMNKNRTQHIMPCPLLPQDPVFFFGRVGGSSIILCTLQRSMFECQTSPFANADFGINIMDVCR